MNQGPVGVDSQTIKLAKTGDQSAISMIVEKYQPYLWLIADKHLDPSLSGRVSPSDVVQNTFAKLPEKLVAFKGRTEPELRAWLKTTLRNAVHDIRRYHLQKKRSISKEEELQSNLFGDANSPSKVMQTKERDSAIEVGLNKLSERDQKILRLRHEQGLTFAEIGKALNVSTDVARMSWGRAISKLKKHITGE